MSKADFPLAPHRIDGGPILDLVEAATARRATRHFHPEPIPAEILESVLHLAGVAPSGYNLQPWRFLVVQDRENRERLKKAAYDQAQVGEAPAVVIVCACENAWREDLETTVAESLRRGAINEKYAGIIRKNVPAGLEKADRRLWSFKVAMLAAAHLLLAAKAYGLDTSPMEGFDEAEVKREFGIPADVGVPCIICIGRGATDPVYPGRLPLTHMAYREAWGKGW